MSNVSYVEKDGQRIDLTGLSVQSEARCDGCGEYLAGQTAVTGSIEILQGRTEVAEQRYDAHPEHALAAIEWACKKAIAEVTPL